MNGFPTENDADYHEALTEIAARFGDVPTAESPEAAHLVALFERVEAYEADKWPIEEPGLFDIVHELMLQRGIRNADLDGITGQQNMLVLLREGHMLIAEQARTLQAELGVPADILLRYMLPASE